MKINDEKYDVDRMSHLEILKWPAKALTTPAQEISVFDFTLEKLVEDMVKTMYKAGGIGLAANQVDVLKKLLIVSIPYVPEDTQTPLEKKQWWHNQLFVCINPKIIHQSGKTRYKEGCLSFPNVLEYISRNACVTVSSYNISGKQYEIQATGLLAICLQHEIDHLNGIVFLKRMSRLKSAMLRKKLKQQIFYKDKGRK